MAKDVFLIRHGEVPEIFHGRYIGRKDPPLSKAGRRDCKYLEKLKVDRVIASPLERALETARFISKNPEIDWRLAEIDFGDWDSMTFEEIAGHCDPEAIRIWSEEPENMVFPNGEKVKDFFIRVEDFMRDLATYPESRIAVVTHGGIIMHVLTEIKKMPPRDQFKVLPLRGTTTKLNYINNAWQIV